MGTFIAGLAVGIIATVAFLSFTGMIGVEIDEGEDEDG